MRSQNISSSIVERNLLIWIVVGSVFVVGIIIFLYPRIKMMRDKVRIKFRVRDIVKRSGAK